MTFVSIFGNKNYINVCTDGLAYNEVESRVEDYDKITRLDDHHFMVVTGRIEEIEKVSQFAKVRLVMSATHSYDTWLDDVRTFVSKIPHEAPSKVMVCLGGKMKTGLRMSSFSNNPDDRLDDLRLIDKGLKYMLLADFEDESGEVVGQLSKSIKTYTDKSMKSRDVMLAQKELAQFVAATKPDHANAKLQTLTFK